MEKTTKTREEILGISSYPHECGGMIEVHTRQDSLKAMQEYADQTLAGYKAKLKEEIEAAVDDLIDQEKHASLSRINIIEIIDSTAL